MDTLEILTPDASGIVSASAGTGKTWLLVSRILRLLLEGRPPGSILAITFTNKAADEMRERLMARLLQWSTASVDELHGHLREIGIEETAPRHRLAARLYETLLYASEPVQITTFHAFCQQILRLFPLQTGAPLNFQVTENIEELHARAIDELFAQATRQPDSDFSRALDALFTLCNGVENARGALKAFLTHRNDWRAMHGDGELEAFQDTGDEGELKKFWQEDMRLRIRQYAEALVRHDVKIRSVPVEQLHESAACETLDAKAFERLHACFFTKKNKPRAVLKKNSPEGFVEALMSLDYDGLVKTIEDTRDRLLQRRNELLNTAWRHAGEHLCGIYRDLKRENGLLDFDDLEWEGGKLLSNEQQLQYRLGSKIEHLLVDEFQDTNPSQWQLLRPLLEEIVSQETGSVFIVGDVKQSIYGFRRADPELQQAAADWLGENCPGSLHPKMNTSRRSAQAIMDCVNRVFGEPEQKAPTGFRTHDTMRTTGGGVRVLDLHESETPPATAWRNPLREPRSSSRGASAEEAESVAQTIARLVKNRLPIEEDGRQRPFQYRDAIVLARQTTRFGTFLQALRTAGIPSVSTREQNFLTSLEVADWIALLEFLQNPRRDDALAEVLRSPIYSLTDEQLWQIARAPGDCWQSKLVSLGRDDKTSWWRRIDRQLTSWIELHGQLPPHDLLDRIYHEANLVQRYRQAVPAQERGRVGDNLDALLEFALDFESGRYPDAGRFLQNLKDLKRLAGNKADTRTPADSDCVRLMSIHGAKGLESPVVFLVDCASGPKDKDTYQTLVDWLPADEKPRQYVLLPVKDQRSSALHDLVERRKQREQREAVNLLYVALTRAKQYLFVSGSGKADGDHWYRKIRDAVGKDGLLGDDALTCTGDHLEQPDAPAKDDGKAPLQLSTTPTAPTAPRIATAKNPSRIAASGGGGGTSDEDGALRGQMIHRALELLNISDFADADALHERLSEEYDEAGESLAAWAQEAWDLVRRPQLAELFTDTLYQQVHNEMPLLYRHNGEQIFGTLDRLCVAENSAWLVDYKTHRTGDPEALGEHYREQMLCYRDGVTKLFPGRKLRTSLLLTANGQLYDY